MAKRNRINKRASKRRRASRHDLRLKRSKSRAAAAPPNVRDVNRLRRWLLPNDQSLTACDQHGNTKWSPSELVWLTLCWAWSESKHLTDAFNDAAYWCRQLGFAAVQTYQGLMNALLIWTDPLMTMLWRRLQQRQEEIGGDFWRIGGWVPIAFDGSRNAAPRTKSNEQAFCAPNYGHGSTAKYRKKKTKGLRRRQNERNKPQPQEPQAWVTLLWHMGLRLPWMWRLGPSNASEREHVSVMVEEGEFSENTLFCGDAGFVGYPLWSRILERGGQFLVRVGANVHLLSEVADCEIGADDEVYCWPQDAQRAGCPPLRLRLVQVTVGKSALWMLTSVLDRSRLPKSRIVAFYKMRWGIEVEIRGLKQTLDRAKLRCRNEQRVLVELSWSILAMAVLELYALKEQLTACGGTKATAAAPADPWRRSLAEAVRAWRRCLTRLHASPQRGEDLRTQLRLAVTDGYQRRSSKRARYRPPNPDKKPLGPPQLRELSERERKKLATFHVENRAA